MKNSIEIYKGKDNQTQIEVKFENNTVWLSQKQIAGVFGTEVPAINKHIKNIIKEGELDAKATISKMEIVQQEGKRQVIREVEFYNLDLIISVGYRVNSSRATQFRIWATQRLKDYLVKKKMDRRYLFFYSTAAELDNKNESQQVRCSE